MSLGPFCSRRKFSGRAADNVEGLQRSGAFDKETPDPIQGSGATKGTTPILPSCKGDFYANSAASPIQPLFGAGPNLLAAMEAESLANFCEVPASSDFSCRQEGMLRGYAAPSKRRRIRFRFQKLESDFARLKVIARHLPEISHRELGGFSRGDGDSSLRGGEDFRSSCAAPFSGDGGLRRMGDSATRGGFISGATGLRGASR